MRNIKVFFVLKKILRHISLLNRLDPFSLYMQSNTAPAATATAVKNDSAVKNYSAVENDSAEKNDSTVENNSAVEKDSAVKNDSTVENDSAVKKRLRRKK